MVIEKTEKKNWPSLDFCPILIGKKKRIIEIQVEEIRIHEVEVKLKSDTFSPIILMYCKVLQQQLKKYMNIKGQTGESYFKTKNIGVLHLKKKITKSYYKK